MSRVGKVPIKVPGNVTVTLQDNLFTAKGPKGELSLKVNPLSIVQIIENQVVVTRKGDLKEDRSVHGLTRALIANLVKGVTEGFEKRLEIIGVGYKFQISGKKIIFNLGFSHPIEMPVPQGIETATDEKNKNLLILRGINKQVLGQFAANIRKHRKPEPYKGKGIKYANEVILRKAGKAAAKK